MSTLSKNIVTDYGCPINGTSDVRSAFLALKADGQGQDVILTLPQHTYKFLSTGTEANKRIFEGLSSLVVIGNGSIITGVEIFLGCSGIPVASPQSTARIQTAFAGEQTVTLVTAAHSSIFTVGRYVALTAIDLQGFGQPPNPYFYEFLKIQAINAIAGTITFTAPLQYSYRSTYPHFNSGSIFEPDLGGPATLYVLPAGFDCAFDFQDLTFSRTDGQQTIGRGRSITYTRCNDTTAFGIIPSLNKSWNAVECDFDNFDMEVDKIVETMTFTGGTARLICQSPCPNLLQATGSTIHFNGTPKRSIISGGSINGLAFGPTGYGRTESFEATETAITSITVPSYLTDTAIYDTSNDVVTYDSGAVAWAIPRCPMMFEGSKESESGFIVSSVDASGNITTTLTNGWLNVPKSGGTLLRIKPHPCPNLNLIDCTGSGTAVDLSQPGARNKPIFSYSKRIYNVASPAGFRVWGRLVQININVSRAYTGAQGTLTLKPFGQFAANALLEDLSALTTWAATINLKVAGTRTITTSAVTKDASDSIAVPGAIWLADVMTPFISASITGEDPLLWPIVEIEVVADQGLPAANTRRVRLTATA